jgi:hypothetical protein
MFSSYFCSLALVLIIWLQSYGFSGKGRLTELRIKQPFLRKMMPSCRKKG